MKDYFQLSLLCLLMTRYFLLFLVESKIFFLYFWTNFIAHMIQNRLIWYLDRSMFDETFWIKSTLLEVGYILETTGYTGGTGVRVRTYFLDQFTACEVLLW